MKFSKNYIQEAIDDLGFKTFTDIQKQVIPSALKGRDIIASSATGTGKTHAFLLPIFERLDATKKDLQVIIVSPTRELAMQLYEACRHIASFSDHPMDIKLYTGGKDRQKEVERLMKQQPQIVIGTPGKIHDLTFKENVLKTYRVQTLVIDEADMALDIGFLSTIDEIARIMPESLQMMVFSATVPEKLQIFLNQYMKHPKTIILKNEDLAELDITHRFIRVSPAKSRDDALLAHMKTINPYLAMIFVNKKPDIERIAKLLYQKKCNVAALHGDMPARKRKQVIKAINRLEYQYVVASDMAARGLDIQGVSHIINYDLPKDMAFYIHRIGRSGRMGASGEAVSFYDDNDGHALEFIRKHKIKAQGIPQPTTRKKTR